MGGADYVIVGGGINGLVAAAMLGKKGRKVLLLERNERVGGCLRTEEITAPGFVHDVMATTLVLFLTSPAYGAIGKDLEARGFGVAHSDLPTGVIRPDGSHVLFSRDRGAQRRDLRGLRPGRRRGLRSGDGPDGRGRALPVLAARRPAVVAADGDHAGRARGLEAGAARACRLVRRGAASGAALSGIDLCVRCDSCALGALGPALRPQSGERLFRADGQGDRLRGGNGRLPDRRRRSQDAALRLRAADRRSGRRAFDAGPMSNGSRPAPMAAPAPSCWPRASASRRRRASFAR